MQSKLVGVLDSQYCWEKKQMQAMSQFQELDVHMI